MNPPDQAAVRNRLLKAMQPNDFSLIQSHLEPVNLKIRQVLIKSNYRIEHFHFVEEGLVSITAEGSTGRVEVGVIGREGAVGINPVLLGSNCIPYDHFVQISGSALRIQAETVIAAASKSPALHSLLSRYIITEIVQVRQTAFANASFEIEARLARWLLMCHDRVGGDEITITHEFLSVMLGVRRAGVTLALQQLEGSGRIKARRGRITIQNRDLLIDIAHTSYGTPEAEYARLVEGA